MCGLHKDGMTEDYAIMHSINEGQIQTFLLLP